MKDWIKAHWKAILAGSSAAVTAFVFAVPDGLTGEEVATIVAAFLFPFGVTWAGPSNKDVPVNDAAGFDH
jgi:formate/nitrite transporter FocA (FNT family)